MGEVDFNHYPLRIVFFCQIIYKSSKWYAGLMISSVMLLTCFVSTSIIVVKNGYLTGLTDLLKPGQ